MSAPSPKASLLARQWQHGGWLSTLLRPLAALTARVVARKRADYRDGRKPADRHDAAYRFLSVMAGDLPKFEDAAREIYLGNRVGYDDFTHDWPAAIRDHGRELAFGSA